MQQTKELNAFFIHMVCSAVSPSCPRAQTVRALHSPRVSHPAQPQGVPPCPPQPQPGTGREGPNVWFLGGYLCPLPLGVRLPQEGESWGAGKESCGGWWPEEFIRSCLCSLIRSPSMTKCSQQPEELMCWRFVLIQLDHCNGDSSHHPDSTWPYCLRALIPHKSVALLWLVCILLINSLSLAICATKWNMYMQRKSHLTVKLQLHFGPAEEKEPRALVAVQCSREGAPTPFLM